MPAMFRKVPRLRGGRSGVARLVQECDPCAPSRSSRRACEREPRGCLQTSRCKPVRGRAAAAPIGGKSVSADERDPETAGADVEGVTMGEARAAAAAWVAQYARDQPWFRGAYIAGSTVGLADGVGLPLGSDVDVMVVRAEAAPPPKPGKFLYRGALLEVSYLASPDLAAAEAVLASHHLAHSLRVAAILEDPTGSLQDLQRRVAAQFAQPEWVWRRCEAVRRSGEAWLSGIDPAAPWHDQVMSWLFGTGATAHILLVAALRNPTVRLRYLRAREVLGEHGCADLYPELLGLLGCADLPPERVLGHVEALGRTFDAAAQAYRTPYRFAADISPDARPIVVDASRALIAAGDHREAVFWVVATFARCHTILAVDAPDLLRALAPAFDALLGDLGIADRDDLLQRAAAVRRFLPRLWETAAVLVAAGAPPSA